MKRSLRTPVGFSALSLFLLSAGLATLLPAQSNPLGYTVRHFSTQNGFSNNKVTAIFQDQMGWIWIGTNHGLNRYNGQSLTTYVYHPEQPDGLPGNCILDLFQTLDGTYWVGTRGKGLGCFRYTEGALRWLSQSQIGNQRPLGLNIRALSESPSGELLIGSAMGLFVKKANAWPPDQISQTFIYNMHSQDADLWFAEAGGISRFNFTTEVLEKIELSSSESAVSIYALNPDTIVFVTRKAVKRISRLESDWYESDITVPEHLLDRAVNTCFLHVQGKVWMALGNELLILNRQLEVVDRYNNGDILNIRDANVTISEMLMDNDGNIWMGTDRGLFELMPVKEFTDPTMLTYAESYGLLRNSLRVDQGLLMAMHDGLYLKADDGRSKLSELKLKSLILAEDGTLYGGAAWESTHGLYAIDTSDWSMTYFGNESGNIFSFTGAATYDLVEDQRGRIWIGAWEGFQLFDPGQGKFVRFPLPDDDITDLQMVGPDLWVATLSGGLFKIKNVQQISDTSDFHFTQYDFDVDDQNSLSSNMVFAMDLDLNGNLWVGTETGLNCYLPAEDRFERIYRLQRGSGSAVENIFRALTTDHQNRIWYGTIGQGLGFYEPMTKRFHHFTEADGLPNNNILLNSASTDDQGYVYFGTEVRCVVFHPDSILESGKAAKPLVLESVSSRTNHRDSLNYFKPKRSDDGYVFAAKDLDYTFVFACPDYSNPNHFTYDVQLEGLHADWVNNGSTGKVTFAKLPTGKYLLRGRVTHLMQDWQSEAKPTFIEVLPPWYRTFAARTVFVILLIVILVVGNQYFLTKRRSESERRILRANNESRKRFFRQITHEFQSPLTIMRGVLGQMRVSQEFKTGYLRRLNHSLEELSHLTQQILSLTKAEAGFSVVRKSWIDLKSITEGLLASYHSLLEERSVEISLAVDPSESLTFMDREKWLYILQNLVLNAVKFSPVGGVVNVSLNRDNKLVELIVTDEGEGIVPAMLPRLFDDFISTARNDAEGTGLGLSLTSELVHLLDGSISASNHAEGGAKFVVVLPAENCPSRRSNYRKKTQDVMTPELPKLLIIEDHPIVAQMMMDALGDGYNISWESDGLDGINYAIESIPDVIITDIVLPGADGYGVCEKIKADFRTNHIPILIVSAKAENVDRIKGWKSGTDAYLTKPYSSRELQAVLNRLLQNRKILQDKYQQHLVTPEVSTDKDPFILQVEEIILNHISDFTFNTEKLAEHVHLSRVQLYRKIKGLTDWSPSDIITSLRMAVAMEKLKSRKYQIAEVAFQVGFKEPSYFSTVFSKYYGRSPSSILKKEGILEPASGKGS